MSRRLLAIAAPLLVAALAFGVRIVDGPGGAYLHGEVGSSDEPAYIGEAFYLYAALDGGAGEELFFSETPPVHQLLLMLAPVLSPFSLDQLSSPPPPTLPPVLASPDGRPYAIAYLPRGSDPALLDESLAAVFSGQSAHLPAQTRWLAEARSVLEAGDPLLLSAITPNGRTVESGLVRVANETSLVATDGGLRILNRANNEEIALLRSEGVRSFATSIGADSPLSILIATIDERSALRVWRMSDQSMSPWATGLILSHEMLFEEAASVSSGPSGDLLVVSAKGARGWELLTYESASSISLVTRTPTDGPLSLEHHAAARETIARDERGVASRLAGGPIVGVRVIVALIGALGTLFAWLFGLRIGGRRLALGAGLLFALDPLGVAAGRVAYQDQTAATMSIGVIAAMSIALSPATRSPLRWFLSLGLIAGLAAATKGFALPIAAVALLAAATTLPRLGRRALAALGFAAAGGLALVALPAGSIGLLLAAVGTVLIGGFLWRSSSPSLGLRPFLLVVAGFAGAYLTSWVVRDLIYTSASGDPIWTSIIGMHLSTLANAAREAGWFVSTWWLWPSGLSAFPLRAIESGSVIWAQGAALALGLVASVGVRGRTAQLVAIALLLAWGSWSIPVRYQMPYYALVPTIAALALVVLAAHERPRGGRIAIAVALFLPLVAGLALPEHAAEVPLALALAVGGWAAASFLLSARALPLGISLVGWTIVWPLAIALALGAPAGLSIVLGISIALAAAGGWRAAPIGSALTSALLLLPEVVELSGLALPSGISPIDWLSGGAHQIHPIGLGALGLLIVASVIGSAGAHRAD